MAEIASLLASARSGDQASAAQLFSALYEDLHRLARARLRQHRTFTLLDTTALLHECFLKVMGAGSLAVADQRHFTAYAATAMRSVIVDFARARLAERRGAGAEHVPLDTELGERLSGAETDVLHVHEALQSLARADARMAQVVEMRYFGGLSDTEIAQALDIHERTVRRDWDKARLLLSELLA